MKERTNMEKLMNVLKLLDIINSLKMSGIEEDWIISGLVTFLEENQVDDAIDFLNSIDVNEIKAARKDIKGTSLSNPDNVISLIDFLKECDN